MGSEPNAGARVCAIEKMSRAEQAGLRVGDRILRVNGEIAKGALEAKVLIEGCSQRKQAIELTVLRARPVKRLPSTCMLERRIAEPQRVHRCRSHLLETMHRRAGLDSDT